MREIKFRGKRLDNGEWIYGSLVIINGRTFIFNDDMRKEVDPKTVGQYTGWKDKNGREIYEGDIVRVTIRENGAEGIGVVEWNEETCVFGLRMGGFLGSKSIAETWRTIDVIGNVHDNPEMLNE